MKNSNKIAEKSEKNRGGGWCSLRNLAKNDCDESLDNEK
jgi:hypothetical protein